MKSAYERKVASIAGEQDLLLVNGWRAAGNKLANDANRTGWRRTWSKPSVHFAWRLTSFFLARVRGSRAGERVDRAGLEESLSF